MLLVEGKIIYYNDSKLAVDYFGTIKTDDGRSTWQCPEHSNPADYFMDMMTKDNMEYDDKVRDPA